LYYPYPKCISPEINDIPGMKSTACGILLLVIIALVAGCTGQAPQYQITTTPATITVVNTQTPILTTTTPVPTPISQGTGVSANTVTIKDFAFTPQTITIKRGEIVRWENLEPQINERDISHRVVFTDPTGNIIKYDSSVLSPGQSWSQKFTDAGTYSYHCKIYSQMTGTVIVE
jgi:plastocyanin